LTGNYDCFDADGDTEGQSTFRWLRCATANGLYQPIPGATSLTYTLTAQDENYFLKFEVTPEAVTGNSPGNASTSYYAGIGPVTSMPQYQVTGAGKSLCNGTYHFQGHIDDQSSYRYGAPFFQKWNGSSYEEIYLYGYYIASSVSCEGSYTCTYYEQRYSFDMYFPEGDYSCDSLYDGGLETCGGTSDLANVLKLN